MTGKWKELSEFEAAADGWISSPCAALDPEAVQVGRVAMPFVWQIFLVSSL